MEAARAALGDMTALAHMIDDDQYGAEIANAEGVMHRMED
jgi:hypothetical protein